MISISRYEYIIHNESHAIKQYMGSYDSCARKRLPTKANNRPFYYDVHRRDDVVLFGGKVMHSDITCSSSYEAFHAEPMNHIILNVVQYTHMYTCIFQEQAKYVLEYDGSWNCRQNHIPGCDIELSICTLE